MASKVWIATPLLTAFAKARNDGLFATIIF